MMKRILFIMFIGLAAFTSVAQSYVSKDSIKYIVDESTRTASLMDGRSRHGALVIPSTVTDGVDDYTVTTIRESAFKKSNITSVTIPNSVTTIGEMAFYDSDKLTTVILGTGVSSIGLSAFWRCFALKAYYVMHDNAIFASNGGVLFNKTGTELIAYPNAKGATYQIPSTVNTIGQYAFYECAGLTQVTIPNSVKYICAGAFSRCKGLTQVTIPNSVTRIIDQAFSECTSLASLTMSSNVEAILPYAFEKTIISEVTLPSTLQELCTYAFYNVATLKKVYCQIKTPLTITKYTFQGSAPGATLYVPTGCSAAYKATNYWKDFGSIVEMDFSIKGDLNDDGSVNVSDVTMLSAHILGETILEDAAKGDINGDGKVDVSDVTSLMGIILQ